MMMDQRNKCQKRKVIIRYEQAKSPTYKQRRRRVFPPPPDPEPLLVDVHSFTELVQSLTGREWSGENAVEEQNSPAVEDSAEDTQPQEHPRREAGENSNSLSGHSDFVSTPCEMMEEMIARVEQEGAKDFCEVLVENHTTVSPSEHDDLLDDLLSPCMDSHFLMADDLPSQDSGDYLQALSPQTRTLVELANLEATHFPTSVSPAEESVVPGDLLFPGTPPSAHRTASENLNFGGGGTGGGGGGEEHAFERDNGNRPLSIWEHFLNEAIHSDHIFQGELGWQTFHREGTNEQQKKPSI